MENREQKRVRAKIYYESHRKQINKKGREYSARMRNAVFAILGDKCKHCGFSDKRALQIDHVNGNGSKERKMIGGRQFYLVVLKKITAGSQEFQILCANCNWIKRIINNENKK